ncbi:sce7725 family protein [Corynebacterium suedekumii]|uniref:Sce7725 family protein n=1 Tax=Corynebacterium suedekumii TaxID=3049801 RepID=A0ABY8VPQ0_9CORY|nr:sce7725 family protein [Corynebacterium suedekumii]WIM71488.1 sce7725 family protein [Corynebacterium suedekumii]
MYHPFFRGKQFELLAIRESAKTIANAGFEPIIEPVRENFSGLGRALNALVVEKAVASVVVNPRHGDHRDEEGSVLKYLVDNFKANEFVCPAILLSSEMTLEQATKLVDEALKGLAAEKATLVHAGFLEGNRIATELSSNRYDGIEFTHVFLDIKNSLYLRAFRDKTRILVVDGFERKKNADYGKLDRFSDIHATYEDYEADGYGDFLTIGDHYSEGGGPAYAVAIHLTFIDPEQEDAMFVRHFVSDSNDTPVDPAGKFQQALGKLVAEVKGSGTPIVRTDAVEEFIALFDRRHFPGLGYVKKLSIKHHLETLALYHADK